MEQAEYELYAQHNGVNYPVLRLLLLMSYKQGAEGQVHACQVQEILNEDKFLHLSIKVGEIVAIKVLDSSQSVITYRNKVTYPKLISTQISSIKKTGNDFGFVKHLAEMLSTKERVPRSSQKVEKVVILMEYVPFTCADLFSKNNDVGKESEGEELFIYNYCKDPGLLLDIRKPYLGGVLRVDTSIIKDLEIAAAVDRVFTACSFIEDLALSLQSFHYMQVSEGVDVTSRHRDLRPPNLGTRQDGSLVILDPGLVLLVEGMSQGFGSTGQSTFNEGYNSPHAIISKQEGNPSYGYADDWFQLAVSIVRILVGEYPFKKSTQPKAEREDAYANNVVSFYQYLQEKLSKKRVDQVINEVMETKDLDKYFYNGFISVLKLLHDPEHPLESSGPLLMLLGQGYKGQEERSESLLKMAVRWRQIAGGNEEYRWEQKLRKDTVRRCVYFNGRKTEVHMLVNGKLNDACGQPGITRWVGAGGKYDGSEYEKLCREVYQDQLYTPILNKEHFKDGKWYGYGDTTESTAEIYWVPKVKEKLTPAELQQIRTKGPVRERWAFERFAEVKHTEYEAESVEEEIIMPFTDEKYEYLEFIKNAAVVDADRTLPVTALTLPVTAPTIPDREEMPVARRKSTRILVGGLAVAVLAGAIVFGVTRRGENTQVTTLSTPSASGQTEPATKPVPVSSAPSSAPSDANSVPAAIDPATLTTLNPKKVGAIGISGMDDGAQAWFNGQPGMKAGTNTKNLVGLTLPLTPISTDSIYLKPIVADSVPSGTKTVPGRTCKVAYWNGGDFGSKVEITYECYSTYTLKVANAYIMVPIEDVAKSSSADNSYMSSIEYRYIYENKPYALVRAAPLGSGKSNSKFESTSLRFGGDDWYSKDKNMAVSFWWYSKTDTMKPAGVVWLNDDNTEAVVSMGSGNLGELDGVDKWTSSS